MINKIKQEFESNNPKLLYIDHKYITHNRLGVGFLFISDYGKVYCGVRIYPVADQKVAWDSDMRTFDSWKDVSVKAVEALGRQR